MRKIATPFLALGLIAVLSAPAGAVSLMTETFSYPDGNLTNNASWTLFSGSIVTSTDIQVSSGTAIGISANTPDDSRGFAAQPTNQKTYYCLNVKLPTGQTASTGMTAFAFLMDATTTNFFGRAYLIPDGANFRFGISPGSCNSPCAPVVWPTPLNYGQQYTLTVAYDPVAGSADLWVDAVAETDPKITSSAFSGTQPVNAAVQKFGLREGAPPTGYTGTTNWTWQLDNLGVGTTFNDACGNVVVPTISDTWGRVKTIYRK
jgi:hypothetical protein